MFFESQSLECFIRRSCYESLKKEVKEDILDGKKKINPLTEIQHHIHVGDDLQ